MAGKAGSGAVAGGVGPDDGARRPHDDAFMMTRSGPYNDPMIAGIGTGSPATEPGASGPPPGVPGARRTAARPMAAVLMALLVFAPLAFGGVEGWARGAIQILAGLLAALWTIERGWSPRPASRSVDRRLAVPAALFVLLVIAQQTPLPPGFVSLLGPGASRLYERTVPGFEQGRSADPADLPAWTIAQVADRMPAAGAGVPLPAAGQIPAEMRSSPAPWRSWRTLSIEPFATREDLVLLLCCVIAFLAAAWMGRSEASLESLARCAVLTVAAVSALGIVQALTWTGRIYWLREGTYKNVFGPFVNRNSYAALAGLVLPVALCAAIAGMRRWRRGAAPAAGAALWAACALAIAAGIALSGSRGGMLTALAGVAAYAALLGPERASPRRRAATMLALVGLIVVAGLVWGGAFAGGSDGRLVHRLDVWRRSLDLVGESPILGSGLGTFRYAFLSHAPPERSWWTTAHNEYLELACDVGLIGAALVLVAFVGWARGVARNSETGRGDDAGLRAGMLAGLLALMLHAGANADLRVPAVALFAAAFAGAIHRAAPDQRPAPTAPSYRTALVIVPVIVFVAVSLQGGISRILAFSGRYIAAEALPRGRLDEAWSGLAGAARWQPADPSTWRTMSTVARNAIGFGIPLRPPGGQAPLDGHGAGLGATARALALNPAHAAAWMDLASLYEAQGLARLKRERMLAGEPASSAGPAQGIQPEDLVAIAASLTAVDLHPEMYLHHEFLARLYWRRGLVEEAGAAIRASFALMPGPSAHDALEEEGLAEALSESILAGIAESKTGPFITEVARLRGKAEMLEILGRLPEAAEIWDAVRETGGAQVAAECDVRRARIDQSLGRFEESLAALERAAVDPDPRWSVEAIYFTGRALSHMGDRPGALDAFARYLERRPDVAAAWQAVGKEKEATGDPAGAETIYRAGLDRNRGDEGLVKLLVALLERQGRTEEASAVRARGGASGAQAEVEEILRQLRRGGARSRP